MNNGSDPYKPDHFLKELKFMYVNSFNRLRFLAEFSTKLQNMQFLDNLRTINWEGNRETTQMTRQIYFPRSNCNIYF